MAVNYEEQRGAPRKSTDCPVEMTWRTGDGEKVFNTCRAFDLSDTGVAIECPESIPPGSNVILWVNAFGVAALAEVRHCRWRDSIYILGLKFLAKSTGTGENPCAQDHYEILRLSPQADQETIDRVYRTLAKRFHPDNQATGNSETFLRIADAYRILSDPAKRGKYDDERTAPKSAPRFNLASREFFNGIRGEQNRRLAIMSLLYRQRVNNHDSPGLTLLDLEGLTGCTREELGFSLWYLCERQLTRVGDNVQYFLTAQGVDLLEERMAEEHASMLRALAAVAGPKEMLTAPNS